jgi:hypothetical protein
MFAACGACFSTTDFSSSDGKLMLGLSYQRWERDVASWYFSDMPNPDQNRLQPNFSFWRSHMSPRDLNAVALSLMMVVAGALGASAEGVRDIVPTGSLRVAVGVGPAASAFWATRDPATGKPRGVTVEIAKAAAEKLRVPLQLVEYPNSGEIAAVSGKDAWDISFMRVVVVVPKGRAATRDWAARFVEDAKADGTVRRALDSSGLAHVKVAP